MTRRGLVLGGGGVLGAAWMIGALAAVRDVGGWEPAEAEVLVGTSAGAVLAALLGCGLDVDALLNHQRGIVVPGDPRIEFDHDTASGGALPPRPRLGIGSWALLAHTVRRPRRFPPLAALSALAPHGQGTLDPIAALVQTVLPAGARWAPHPATWIVAMDYDSGRRVPLGRPGEPELTLPAAVTASCAIPGWYAPVLVNGHRYVDGGTCSPTSVDLLAGMGLDEVVVLAPMATFAADRPSSMLGRVERRFRRAFTRRMQHEADKVRRSGTRVVLVAPNAEDLATIGLNLMDPSRRLQVLDTSLRTSAEALARGGSPVVAAG